MFNLREFVKKGFLSAVGRMAEFQIRLNAAAWLEKGVLTEEDLAEIEVLLAAQAAADEAEPEADIADEQAEPAETEVVEA